MRQAISTETDTHAFAHVQELTKFNLKNQVWTTAWEGVEGESKCEEKGRAAGFSQATYHAYIVENITLNPINM